MRNRILVIFILALSVTMCQSAHARWATHERVEYKDLLFYEGDGEEIIMYMNNSRGLGHHYQGMRIYLFKDPMMSLIFDIDLVDEHYFSGIYPKEHIAFVNEVSFDEMRDGGLTDIIVKMKKVIFSDDENKELPDREDTGIFVWGDKPLKEELLGEVRFQFNDGQYVLVGELPEKLRQKFEHEEKVWEEIKSKGKKIGDSWFF